MSSAIITPAMQAPIRGPVRTPCWLFWFEGADSDLYAWSGAHAITWDGHTFVGMGAMFDMETLRKPDALQHVEYVFKLNGLEGSMIADLDESVRGRGGKVWLGMLNAAGQVIRDPLLVGEFTQDTLKWERQNDDTVSLTLTTFEALPFLGRARNEKYSHERWMQEREDTGFFYTSPIAATGRAVDWRP